MVSAFQVLSSLWAYSGPHRQKTNQQVLTNDYPLSTKNLVYLNVRRKKRSDVKILFTVKHYVLC